MVAPDNQDKLRKERTKEIAKTLYMPPEIYENLTEVAVRMSVPIEIVAEAAFVYFAKLDTLEQRQLVLSYHYVGPIGERGPHGSRTRKLVWCGISTIRKCHLYLRQKLRACWNR